MQFGICRKRARRRHLCLCLTPHTVTKAQCVWVITQLPIPTDAQVTTHRARLRHIQPMDGVHIHLVIKLRACPGRRGERAPLCRWRDPLFYVNAARIARQLQTGRFHHQNRSGVESYATNNALSQFHFSVATDGATYSPLFVSAENAICLRRALALQETGCIRLHLLAGHERIAKAGSACNTQVPSRLAVHVIPLYAYLCSCSSHELNASVCHLVS